MILFTSGFLCIVVLLVLYCPVRSGENEVTTLNGELNENKIKGIQDGGHYIQKDIISVNQQNRKSIAARVINGNTTGIKSHPYLAAFMRKKNRLFCGGTIISSEFIMTAAHCVANYTTGKYFNLYSSSVFLGVHNRLTMRNAKEFTIERAIVHENYGKKGFGGFLHHDIALVKIRPQIDYNPFIQRICLTENDMNVIDTSTTGTFQGWGLDRPNGTLTQYVMKTTLRIISGDKCSTFFQNQSHLADHNSVVCGRDHGYVSGPCNGDSGGPLFVKKPGGIKVQIGVVSHGGLCHFYPIPAIFQRVSHFLPWILTYVPRSTVCLTDI